MRKICIFCETWESGGIEAFQRNVLCTMNRENMEIHLVAESLKESVFTEEMIAAGIRFFSLSGNTRRFFENLILFRNLIRSEQYDVLHLNIYQGLSLAYASVARQEGIPVRIAHSHNTALRKSRLRTVKLLLHRLGSAAFASDANVFWACSSEAASFMFPAKKLRETGYSFIPNGIDTNRFAFDAQVRERIRKQMRLQDAFVIGHVGRLCSQKNQLFLIELMPELLKRMPQSTLLLIGEGEDRPILEARVRSLGLEEHVVFRGTTDRVEEYYWAMDVLGFPSLFEGLGIAVIEAQASGLPAVCSDCVPAETNITPLVSYLSTQRREEWIDRLLKRTAVDRRPFARMVKSKGFDILDVSAMINAEYLRQMQEARTE